MPNYPAQKETKLYSPAKRIGKLLAKEFKRDSHFYFFSPDETTSNKFDKVFEVEKRAWGDLPQEKWDLPESANGRIVEMLSENVLFSTMTGHLNNGERAMMGSYEAFFPIITAQLLQQLKFIKQSKATTWRKPIPAVNLLSTSICWRQDHNGFTHQSPALISTLLSVPSNLTNCFFPIDDVSAEIIYNFMISSENVVNLTTFDKNDRPRYFNFEQANSILNDGGASIFTDISDSKPEVVLVACGDIVAHESIKAIEIIKKDFNAKIRFIYVGALSHCGIGITENKLAKARFDEMFTKDKPIIANFHGYPETLCSILCSYANRGRLSVHGFNEEGSTTTPFEMLRRNKASRYDIAIDIANHYGRLDLVSKYKSLLVKNHINARKYGEDNPEIFN